MTSKKSPLREAIDKKKVKHSRISDDEIFTLADYETVKLPPTGVKGKYRKALRRLKGKMAGITEAGIIRRALFIYLRDHDEIQDSEVDE